MGRSSIAERHVYFRLNPFLNVSACRKWADTETPGQARPRGFPSRYPGAANAHVSRVARARLWPRLVEAYADFDTYQVWTEREIPVVILRPAG